MTTKSFYNKHNVFQIKKVSGHKTLNVIQTYVELAETIMSNVSQTLDRSKKQPIPDNTPQKPTPPEKPQSKQEEKPKQDNKTPTDSYIALLKDGLITQEQFIELVREEKQQKTDNIYGYS